MLLCQLLASELAGLAAALHLLLQVGRFLLQAKQDVLALLVLADTVLQLVQAQGQPLCALVRVLGLPLLMQWMRFKARREGLLFFNEVLMLHTQFLDLRFHCAEFIAQLTARSVEDRPADAMEEQRLLRTVISGMPMEAWLYRRSDDPMRDESTGDGESPLAPNGLVASRGEGGHDAAAPTPAVAQSDYPPQPPAPSSPSSSAATSADMSPDMSPDT